MRKHTFGRDRNRLAEENLPTPVVCTTQSFARFSRWIDGELAKLERRWQHAAAPVARQPSVRQAFREMLSSWMPKSKPKPK